jgi:hypothetical protein
VLTRNGGGWSCGPSLVCRHLQRAIHDGIHDGIHAGTIFFLGDNPDRAPGRGLPFGRGRGLLCRFDAFDVDLRVEILLKAVLQLDALSFGIRGHGKAKESFEHHFVVVFFICLTLMVEIDLERQKRKFQLVGNEVESFGCVLLLEKLSLVPAALR